jgi:hypothetical protein
MHEGKQGCVGIGGKGLFHLGGIHRCAPWIFHDNRHPTATTHILGHALTKHPVDAHHHLVTGADQVHKAGFHPYRTRRGNREGQLVLRLEGVAQQALELIHHADEGRIQVADGGTGHGGQHPRRNIGRPGPHQGAGGRLEGRDTGRIDLHGVS